MTCKFKRDVDPTGKPYLYLIYPTATELYSTKFSILITPVLSYQEEPLTNQLDYLVPSDGPSVVL